MYCVVSFDSNDETSLAYVPLTCIQSVQGDKIALNKSYLFVHKTNRSIKERGKLLFRGEESTLQEVKTYCELEDNAVIDDTTWIDQPEVFTNVTNTTAKSKTKPTATQKGAIKCGPYQAGASSTKKKTKRAINQNESDDDNNNDTGNEDDDVEVGNNDELENVENRTRSRPQEQRTKTKLPHCDNSRPSTSSSSPNQPITTTSSVCTNDDIILPRYIQLELESNRKRIIDLEEQLVEIKRCSIPFPNDAEVDYMRRLVAIVDFRAKVANVQAIEVSIIDFHRKGSISTIELVVYFFQIGQKLGLTDAELFKAVGNMKTDWKKITTNLLVACHKGVELENENYSTLCKKNKDRIDNIFSKLFVVFMLYEKLNAFLIFADYVKLLRPADTIAQGVFSTTISNKCHHLKSDKKRKQLKQFEATNIDDKQEEQKGGEDQRQEDNEHGESNVF
ncbi:unnamed protein product [Didymodactylos carnosus]|uniref:Uncharacterized protein n=1 Tax=Didymodactylos carnosus TaxID=1234261 RepID=A0A8S2DXC1_9BILA|nr:unnamed protein product [Didymodactylos carnosus]CAF3800481.1 unnamed protein product [Didymodactylos carnosus]